MTTEELARDVLHLLDKQKEYFNCTDQELKRALLIECKQLEGRLRRACTEIVDPKPKKKTLFDQIEENDHGGA